MAPALNFPNIHPPSVHDPAIRELTPGPAGATLASVLNGSTHHTTYRKDHPCPSKALLYSNSPKEQPPPPPPRPRSTILQPL